MQRSRSGIFWPPTMGHPGIRIIEEEGTPLSQAMADRITDWHEDGRHIIRLGDKYGAEYEKKICSTCTVQQKAKRHAIKYEAGGKQRCHCFLKQQSINRRIKKRGQIHFWSHPLLAEVRKNAIASGHLKLD